MSMNRLIKQIKNNLGVNKNMILNEKTKLFKKAVVFSLLLFYAQSPLVFAQSATLKSGIDTNSIVNLNTYDRNTDTSTLKLNGAGKITNSKAKISISLRESDVQQVLRMFADKAGLNIVFHESTAKGKITLDLINTNLNDAFLSVMDTCNLSYYLEGNTITIAGKDEISKLNFGKQNMTVLPVKYVDAKDVANFLNKNVFSSKITGLSSDEPVTYNPRTNEIMVFGSKSDVEAVKSIIPKLDTKPMINSFKVNHTTPKEMATLICESVFDVEMDDEEDSSSDSSSSSSSSGVASSSEGTDMKVGGGTVACRSTESGGTSGSPSSSSGGGGAGGAEGKVTHEAFGKAAITVTYFPQLGKIGIYGGSATQVEVIKEFIADNDKKQLMAYIELSVVELNEKGSKDFNNYWNLSTPFMDVAFSKDGRVSANGVNIFSDMVKSGSQWFVPASRWVQEGAPDNLKWVLKSSPTGTNAVYGIDYAISNGNGRVLTNPKLMVTNGQTSTIDLSSDYVKTVTTQFSESTMGTPITNKTYEIGNDNGLKIEVVPFISLDGYVSLNIKPDYSTIKERVMGATSDGKTTETDLVATLLQRRNLELKNIRVKDGETIVIGGLISEEETQSVKKIPLLGDLPVVGVLFRQSSSSKSKQELVIMITPHIVYDDEQMAEVKKENL